MGDILSKGKNIPFGSEKRQQLVETKPHDYIKRKMKDTITNNTDDQHELSLTFQLSHRWIT